MAPPPAASPSRYPATSASKRVFPLLPSVCEVLLDGERRGRELSSAVPSVVVTRTGSDSNGVDLATARVLDDDPLRIPGAALSRRMP